MKTKHNKPQPPQEDLELWQNKPQRDPREKKHRDQERLRHREERWN